MPLEDLVCAGCGAPLKTANAQGAAIVCPYCSREHVFVTPPPEPSRHEHPVGSSVVVKWGSRWWPAQVVSVEGPDRWKIHYTGWASSWDETVGPDRIRPADAKAPTAPAAGRGARPFLLAALLVVVAVVAFVVLQQSPAGVQPTGRPADQFTPLAIGQPVQVRWNDAWYEGHIRAVYPDGRVRVHYEGWDDSFDEDVDRARVLQLPGGSQVVQPGGTVATPSTELTEGQRVQVEWLGNWYDGTVLGTELDGSVRVHYEGWDESYDEAVGRNRIRVP